MTTKTSSTIETVLESLPAIRHGANSRRTIAAEFEEFAVIAAAVATTPTSLVLLSDLERSRACAQVGPMHVELPAESPFYRLTAEAPDCLEVSDALNDPRFANDSLVTSGPRIRFFAGLALRTRNEECLGVLCVFDRLPRVLRAEQRQALTIIARKLADLADARRIAPKGPRPDAARQNALRALSRAMDASEFRLQYQPKVDLRANRIVGLEALLRWNSAELGTISPTMFVPLLEESGLILPVGTWVIQQALSDYRHMVEKGLNAPSIAVNVSPLQLAEGDFVSDFERMLGGSARRAPLDIEITEGMLLEKTGATIRKLNAIRSMGVHVAIDDFGTGYSSLRYLAHLPIDALKIDRSFVSTMADDADDMAIVSSIIALAHGLDLDVIAEGVETVDQRKLLKLLRCDQMQGFLFSPPVDRDRIEELLIADSNAATHRHKALQDGGTDIGLEDRRRNSNRSRR
jgi:EAL domain-containing protein (putative c-di-GMP-specific phosphodiesterase class I)